MRITEHTTKVLRVQLKGWIDRCLGMLIVGAFPVFGMLVILVDSIFFPKVHLSCSRANVLSVDTEPAQIVCSLTSSSVWSENVNIIKHLQGAKADISYAGGDRTYRVVLITDSKKIPLTEEYVSSKSEISQHVAEIKAFINNPGESPLNIYEDHRWISYLAGVGFIIFGVFFLFVKSLTSCTFDKSSGRLYLEHQTILSQSDIREESLDDIKMIKVDETTNDKGKKIYSAKIVLKSGALISLGLVKNDYAIAKTINQFLGIDNLVDC